MQGERILDTIFDVGLTASIVATVVSLGLSFTVKDVIAPLRRRGLVCAVVVLNVAVMPATAWAIASVAGLPKGAAAGIAVVAVGSGGAAGLKAAQLSGRADLPLAISLIVILQIANIVAVPLWIPRIVGNAATDPVMVLQGLVAIVLVPMAIGMLVRARSQIVATRSREALVRVANVALVIAIAAGVAANLPAIGTAFASRTILVSLSIVAVGIGAGAALGWRDVATSTTTALVTGMRFAGLGIVVVGTQLNDGQAALGPAIAYALTDLVVALAFALFVSRRTIATP